MALEGAAEASFPDGLFFDCAGLIVAGIHPVILIVRGMGRGGSVRISEDRPRIGEALPADLLVRMHVPIGNIFLGRHRDVYDGEDDRHRTDEKIYRAPNHLTDIIELKVSAKMPE